MRRKNIYLILWLNAIVLSAWSQQIIVPKKNVVEKQWVHNQSYQMTWTMLKDTTSIELGTVNTQVQVAENKVLVLTKVNLKSSPSSWIDSTIVNQTDLSPIYHSSYNAQRDMAIHFGEKIKGFYRDKQTGETTQIAQDIKSGYFDSNFYPMLINWLPLKPDFKADIDIYDYNPKGKTGLLKAHILSVHEGIYLSKNLKPRKIWVVEVTDEIGSAKNTKISYQIDQLTRQLYKQLIYVGERVMMMTLVEN